MVDLITSHKMIKRYRHFFLFTNDVIIPGVLSHKAVREKIVRAFLIEEQKLCNLLMRDQQVGGKKE